MGGIQRFLIVETDVREERATTVQAPQQCHVTLTLVARITAAACQQIGQSCKDIVRNIRCLGTQIVIFFQHYFRGIFLIGAVAGVISDPAPFLTPIRLFFLFLQLPNKLITRQHALTNIFSREITRRITPGEKGDQLFKFFRRKTFTSCHTSQLQCQIVAITATEGIVPFKLIEQTGNKSACYRRSIRNDNLQCL